MFRATVAVILLVSSAMLIGCSRSAPSSPSSAAAYPAQPAGQQPVTTVATDQRGATPGSVQQADRQQRDAQIAEAVRQSLARQQSGMAAEAERQRQIREDRDAAWADARAAQQQRQSREQAASMEALAEPFTFDETAIANTVAGQVEAALVNPAGAKWGTPTITREGPQTTDKATRQVVTRFRVSGIVDSTNRMNATVRMTYTGVVRTQRGPNGLSYSLVPGSLSVDE